jgi:hypothetical protein
VPLEVGCAQQSPTLRVGVNNQSALQPLLAYAVTCGPRHRPSTDGTYHSGQEYTWIAGKRYLAPINHEVKSGVCGFNHAADRSNNLNWGTLLPTACAICRARLLVCAHCGCKWYPDGCGYPGHVTTVVLFPDGQPGIAVSPCPNVALQATRELLEANRRNGISFKYVLVRSGDYHPVAFTPKHHFDRVPVRTFQPDYSSVAYPVPAFKRSADLDAACTRSSGLFGTHWDFERHFSKYHLLRTRDRQSTFDGSIPSSFCHRLLSRDGSSNPVYFVPFNQLRYLGRRSRDRTIGTWSELDHQFVPTFHPGSHTDIAVSYTARALGQWLEFVRDGFDSDDEEQQDWSRSWQPWLNYRGGPLDWPVCVWTYRVAKGIRVSDWIAHPVV